MKKHGILNSSISRVLSSMGHTDTIAIGDCGLPIPDGPERIDLALTLGVPGFMEVLKAVSDDMKIEKIVMAEEIQLQNPDILNSIMELFAKDVQVEFVPHVQFKARTGQCKAVIRTGEHTPYANIILQSGCIF